MTAGNASGLNDGAAAVMLMSAARADEFGLTPLTHAVRRRLSSRCRGHRTVIRQPVRLLTAFQNP